MPSTCILLHEDLLYRAPTPSPIEGMCLTGLESHPDHDIAMEQMTGFGGVISFEVDGDLWRTAKFVDSVCAFIT